ncbi:MAG: hypothetical protein DHS20C18_20860 [Saprospiraceae bacterium]|nr:MAG: hypothetical protein DHS20C18_20860 [Saprospiraceae bacterium]
MVNKKDMNKPRISMLFILVTLFFVITSCEDKDSGGEDNLAIESNNSQNEKDFTATLEKHLKAVSNKDLISLKSTMSPNNKMQLILPGSEIINSVDGFMKYHEEWFQDTAWTFETKIINTEVGERNGIAVTEIIYREPERDGKPYFNRMIVSYGLEKFNDKWYIILDHASSIEKSTDNQ